MKKIKYKELKNTAQEKTTFGQYNVSIPSIVLELTPQQYEELKKNLLFDLQKLQIRLF